MASLDVQPRLTEARPDPDTPAQMRAAVARYLAANALKDKALSTEQQRGWAAREEKYRKEFEQVGVWAVGVKVNTGLTTAAWEYTLKESEWAATRRTNAKKVRDKDSVDYRKKREKYTYALLNAYNAAINMEARKREGRPADLSRQEKTVLRGLSAPPHVEERAAPLTLDGADVEGKGTPCGEENTSLRNNTYPSLEENPPFPNIARAPPPYGCYDHPAPRKSKDPALQFPILHTEKGPVDVSYDDQPQTSFAGGRQDYGGIDINNNSINSPTPNSTQPSSSSSYNPTPDSTQPSSSSSSYNPTPSSTQPRCSSSSYNPTPNSTQPSSSSSSSYNPTPNPTQPNNNSSSNNKTPETTHPNSNNKATPNPTQPNNNNRSNNKTPKPTHPNSSNKASPNPTRPNSNKATPNSTQPHSSNNKTPETMHPNSSYNTIHNNHNTRELNNPSSINKGIKPDPTKDNTDKDTRGTHTPLTFKDKGWTTVEPHSTCKGSP
ncbi:unnamed protein product [Gadus morhua 'NCC']